MNQPRLESKDNGHLYLTGELNMETVPGLLNQHQLFTGKEKLTINLEGVGRADSAGVALLVWWQRKANLLQRSIIFENIPPQMLAIARVSGIDELLALNANS